MTEAESRDVEPPREAGATTAPAEPATARALWPTFMRRTLAEDVLDRAGAAAK